MIWIVVGSFTLGLLLCTGAIMMDGARWGERHAPFPWFAGCVMIVVAVVLAIGNVAVEALL